MTQTARSTSGQAPAQAQIDGMRNLSTSYSAKLDSLLGPEVAEAYRSQGMGRMFSPGRTGPRTLVPVSGAQATPLVPITR